MAQTLMYFRLIATHPVMKRKTFKTLA